jgi:hypothetical protein
VPTPASGALEVAHALALERLAADSANRSRAPELSLLREMVLARTHPAAVSARVLAEYGGDYRGGGLITLQAGALWQQTRRDQPRTELVPLSATRFAAKAVRFEFVKGANGALSVKVQRPGEAAVTYERLGASAR